MKYYLPFWLPMVLLALQHELLAQHYNVQLFDTRQGLYTPNVRRLLEDSHGYLWVGTMEGLYRFDGSKFQKFNQPNGLPFSDPHYLVEDQDGHIIIYCNDKKKSLFAFDGKKWKQISLSPDVVRGINRPGDEKREWFNGFCFDRGGNFWGILSDGIIRLDPQTWRQAKLEGVIKKGDYKYVTDEFLSGFLASTDVAFDLVFNVRNRLYLFKESKLRLVAELEKDDPKAYIQQILSISPDTLLVTTRSGKLFKISKNGQAREIFRAGKAEGFSAETMARHPLTGKMILQCQNGVITFSPHLKPLHYYNLFDSIGIKVCVTMTVDKNGNIWVGSTEGLVRLSPNRVKFDVFPESNYPWEDGLYSIFRDANGRLLVGTSNGTVYSQNDEGDFKKELVLPKDDWPRIGEVSQIFEDHAGNAWFLSWWSGLWRKEGNFIRRYWEQNGLPLGLESYHCLEDSKHRFWVGLGWGVGYFNNDWVSTSTTTLAPIFKEIRDNNQGFRVRSILEDRFGSIWLGMNGRLAYVDKDSIVTVIYPLEITDIQLHGRDEIWVATSGQGIYCFKITGFNRLQTTPIYHYKKSDGLIDDVIASLEPDDQGNLWAASYTGLSVLRKRGGSHVFSNFNASDGLFQASYANVTLYNDHRGKIWGATSRGLFSFRPTDFVLSEEVPQVVIRGVEIPNSVLPSDFFLSEKKLRLKWYQNALTIQYSIQSLGDQTKNRYRYRLLGGNRIWETVTTEGEAKFQSLESGTYRFEVEACNADGVWSGQPTTLSFVVAPPLYRRPVFWVAILLVFLTGMYRFHRHRLYLLRLEKERAEGQVRLAVAEKEAAENRELMERSEKETSQYKEQALRLKLNPHFIFNSLSAIMGRLRSRDIATAENYLDKFSTLMRVILEKSADMLVSLEVELSIVEKYVEFENFRTGNIFNFQVSIADEELLGYQVLNNLLQPFVENAIVHGLKPKTSSEKSLSILVESDEDHLYCHIEDNGVGREQAKKNKEMHPDAHLSTALPTLSERLAEITRLTGKKAGFEFFDLKDKDHTPIGTRVSITIPKCLDSLLSKT